MSQPQFFNLEGRLLNLEFRLFLQSNQNLIVLVLFLLGLNLAFVVGFLRLTLHLQNRDLVFRLPLDVLRPQSATLAEFSLQVREQTLGTNADVIDLYGFKPNAPSSQLGLELLAHLLPQHRSVLKQVD